MSTKVFTSSVLPLIVVGLAGCSQSDFGNRPTADTWTGYEDGGNRPGDDARDADPEIVCDTNRDCGNGEQCIEGICQMARCDDAYTSAPPLRSGLRFFADRELLVSDGSEYVVGYAPQAGGGIQHAQTWKAGGAVTDLASGVFTDGMAESSVVVRAASNTVTLADGGQTSITLDYPPIAVAAGDTNNDGRDEAVVLGAFGNVSVCNMQARECTSFPIEGDGKDITMGDVDGDGFAESIVLLAQGDQKVLYVWNHDKDETGQKDFWTSVDKHVSRIAAGDFDGDGIVEVAAKADENTFGVNPAMLHVFKVDGAAFQQVGSQEIASNATDLAAGDLNMDKRDDLVILQTNNTVQVMHPSEKSLPFVSEGVYNVGQNVGGQRIATGDFDGDSPRARLMNETAELLPGPVAPLAVIHYAPYDAERSSGTGSASVGNSMNMSENWEESVAMFAHATVGVDINLPPIVSVNLSATLSSEVSKSQSFSKGTSISRTTSASPTEDMRGLQQGVVMLSCACYHVYRYEVEDPQQRLGLPEAREPFVVVLPVGGTVTGWSTKRYNLMADALGGLPIVEIPYEIGNPRSYPTGPQRADGSPVAVEDLVFPELPSFLVSDVGDVSWFLLANEETSNTEGTSQTWDVSADLGIGPFKLGAGGGKSRGSSYTVSVGTAARFGGAVPPIRDNPSTPEDEYLEYAFSFAPYVYREHYETADGSDAANYVLSFAVGEERQ